MVSHLKVVETFWVTEEENKMVSVRIQSIYVSILVGDTRGLGRLY